MSRNTTGTRATNTTEELSVDFRQGREILPLLQLSIQTLMSIQYPVQCQSGVIFRGLVREGRKTYPAPP
jgi:hypothetical protein